MPDLTFSGPDEDGFVWAHWVDGPEGNTIERSVKIGKLDDVVEAMSGFLGEQDYGE